MAQLDPNRPQERRVRVNGKTIVGKPPGSYAVPKLDKQLWARQHTWSLKDWRIRLVAAIVLAALAIGALRLAGSTAGLRDEAIVAGATLFGAFVLIPACEYAARRLTAGEPVAVQKARHLEVELDDAKRERDAAREQLDRRDEHVQARDLLASQRQAALDLKSRPVSSDKEFGAWATEYETWRHATSLIIGQVFGPPEVQRFKDPGHIMAAKVIGSFNNEHNSLRLWLEEHRRYLVELDARLAKRVDQP